MVLHDWRIDEAEYRRHELRRGRRHAFERLDGARTALVVVDMVPFFCAENPYAEGIVGNVNRLAAALHRAAGVVAWVVPALVEPSPARRELLGDEVAERYAASGGSGPPVGRLWPALDVDADDLVVEKLAASAFFPGHCDLDQLLRDRRVDTVLVAGTVAEVCCESTARDAATLGYRVVFLADANATGTDAALNATLRTVYRSFGDVRTTDEVVELLRS